MFQGTGNEATRNLYLKNSTKQTENIRLVYYNIDFIMKVLRRKVIPFFW